MEFLIISGLSGAGKSRAADILEDLDYYCVDNLPVALIPRFAELCLATQDRYEKVALVMDIRERDGFKDLFTTLDSLGEMGLTYRLLFMDADIPTLVKRYKESRRPHPLAANGLSTEDAIRREAELMMPIRARADYVVNTGNLTLGRLQQRIFSLFAGEGERRELTVNLTAFGYKYGVPMDSDLVIDVRFLPNPYYEEALRTLTGLDEAVGAYVLDCDTSREFMSRLEGLIDFLLPLYVDEGKHALSIAIGCTGGRHRSVAVAEALGRHLRQSSIRAVNFNRDIDK